MTTTRKIFTTVYSVFRNPANRLNSGQWGGCSLVFVGLLMDILFQAVCPKKKEAPKPPPAATEDVEMHEANDEEGGNERRGLLAK